MNMTLTSKLVAAVAAAFVLIPAPSFAEQQWERDSREFRQQQNREFERRLAAGEYPQGVSAGNALKLGLVLLVLTAMLNESPEASRSR